MAKNSLQDKKLTTCTTYAMTCSLATGNPYENTNSFFIHKRRYFARYCKSHGLFLHSPQHFHNAPYRPRQSLSHTKLSTANGIYVLQRFFNAHSIFQSNYHSLVASAHSSGLGPLLRIDGARAALPKDVPAAGGTFTTGRPYDAGTQHGLLAAAGA